jgi:hypothetical protein
LTQLEEISIVSFILDHFISQQLIFTGSDFREMVLSLFLHQYDQSEDEPPPFQCSADFLNSFKSRHGFASHGIQYKRRPAGTEEQRQNWIQKIQEVFQTVPRSCIVGRNETA